MSSGLRSKTTAPPVWVREWPTRMSSLPSPTTPSRVPVSGIDVDSSLEESKSSASVSSSAPGLSAVPRPTSFSLAASAIGASGTPPSQPVHGTASLIISGNNNVVHHSPNNSNNNSDSEDPDSVRAASSHSVPVSSCGAYLEDLREDGMKSLDVCACNRLVLAHPRRPAVLPPPSPTGFPTPTSAVSNPKTILSPFLKLTSRLPIWNRPSGTTCYDFIKQIEHTLFSSGIPECDWFKVFTYVVHGDDVSAMEWVITNIVKKQLTWSQSCASFTAHFELCDSRVTLQKRYDDCKQSKNGTVQSYCDEFRVLCDRLSIPDNEQTIHHFLDGLSPSMFGYYQRTLSNMEVMQSTFVASSLMLEDVMRMCIKLDVSNRSIAEKRGKHESLPRPGLTPTPKTPVAVPRSPAGILSTKPRATGDKHCDYHPTARSHTTAQCKNKPEEGKPHPPASISKKIIPDDTSSVPRPITCYSCGVTGHKSPDCPKKQSSATPSKNVKTSSLSVIVNKLDLTLPSSVLCPRERSTPLELLCHGRLFSTLLDTGADISVIDRTLATTLGLHINPIAGKLILANNSTTDRNGQTDPLDVTVLFPHSDLKAKALTHRFEVMDLPTEQYSFILGVDLATVLFGSSIPLQFLSVKPSHSTLHVNGVRLMADATLDGSLSLVEMIPSVCLRSCTMLNDPSVHSVSPLGLVSSKNFGLSVPLLDDASMVTAPVPLVNPSDDDLEELPSRLELSTADSVKVEYEAKRHEIAIDPDLIEALATNEKITGFCTLPDSFLHLEVASEKRVNLYRKQYPIEQSLIDKATPIIDRWFAAGKIMLAPPLCRYNNPITVAKKKDANGDWTDVRVCLDTRALNEALSCGDNFQLPYIRTALEMFAGCAIFGEFDLVEAYLQFMLTEESRQFTAFTWNGIQYMFVGCPFGINLLPSFFQRIMSTVFHGLSFTFPYLDNLPIASRTWEDHRDHLLIVVDRLNKVNLKIKPSSIKFGYSEMRCLGYLLSHRGIGIDPKKVAAVSNWVLPTTGKELQIFLGFVTYVRDHIRHVAELTAPLEAIKNHKTITWNDSLIEHFELTKKAVCAAPFLKLPDFSMPFHIATDASNTGVGGVLYQPAVDDKDDMTSSNIVAICSKKLNSSQCNYSPYKKELYGIVYCLKKFHCYVWGRNDLVLVTDHKPLTFMLKTPDLSEALRRWLDTILDYKFVIRHRAGILNVVPDALSRMFGSVYEHSSAWGVATNSAVTNILSEMKVTDSSDNASPTGTLRVLSTTTATGSPPIAYVAESSIAGAGLGLFAGKAFRGPKKNKHSTTPGERITIYDGKLLVVGLDEFDEDETYLLKIKEGFYLDASEVDASSAGLGRFANRPIPPMKGNARLSVNTDTLVVSLIATRNISKGDEILIPYGRALRHDINGARVRALTLGSTLDDLNSFVRGEGCTATTTAVHEHLAVKTLDLSFTPGNEAKLLAEMELRGKTIPPPEQRDELLEQEHMFGHFGRDAIYAKLTEKGYWWPRMRDDIVKKLVSCDPCTRYTVTKSGFHPATSVTAHGPMDHLQIDCSVHLPPDANGFTTLLVIIDVFTGFVFLRAIKTTSAECVAQALWELFCTFGLPKILQSDNGPEFVNKIIAALVRITGVDHRFISPYHPAADGKVERSIGSIVLAIKKLLHGYTKLWSLFVPFVQLAFNNKIASLTNSTPFSLFFTRTLNPFKDYSSTDVNTPLIDFDDWKVYQEKVLSLIYPAISDAIGTKKSAMVDRLNKHRRQLLDDSIPAGAIVMLKDPLRTDKFQPKYLGPYSVVRRTRWGAYQLRDATGDNLDRAVPVDQLKLLSRKPRPIDIENEVFRVEKVLSHRGTPGHYDYYTKWVGYPEPTWNPDSNFLDDQCIKDYWKTLPSDASSSACSSSSTSSS